MALNGFLVYPTQTHQRVHTLPIMYTTFNGLVTSSSVVGDIQFHLFSFFGKTAAYLNLGLLLSKQGQHDQAVHWLRACSQLDGSGVRDPQVHRHSQIQSLISWGQLELSRGQAQTAIQLYKQALRRSPTNVQQLQVRKTGL